MKRKNQTIFKTEKKHRQSLNYTPKASSNMFFDYSHVKSISIKKGLDFIKFDFSQNYLDLKHIMYLGNLEGFDNKFQIHISDTFQRALLNDCLLSVSKNNKIDISLFIESECQYLIDQRNNDKVGGWSYFPTVHELAADIDDMGQIMQLFTNCNKKELIDKYCKKGILFALNDRMLSDGGIETWIIPKKKQEYFNETKWGKGPDVEVVANFIYALNIYEKTKYKETIDKAIVYVLKQQNDKGFWESRWYYGNYYGTYVCLKLLNEFEDKYSNHIQKALDYLINSPYARII